MTSPKINEKQKAIQLRLSGKSYNEILSLLKVSKGSLSLWLRDIPISSEKKKELNRRGYMNGQVQATLAMQKKWKLWRDEAREEGRQLALKSSNSLMIIGCTLYWCEGSKNRNRIVLPNTCPELAKKFYDFLIFSLKIPTSKIKIEFIYHGDEGNAAVEDSKKFWSNLFGINESCVTATKNKDKRERTGFKKNRHLHGVVIVSVISTKYAQMLYGAMEICTNKVFNP